MAGRQFKSSSLRPEQLQGMGISGKDMPSSAVTPPPTFPPLMSKPALLETNPDREFMINWDEQFLVYLKSSPFFTGTEQTKHMHSKYFIESSRMENGGFHWHLMPSELKPNFKRKLNAKDGPNKLGKIVNVEEAFKALEQKEKTRKPGSTAVEDDNESDKEDVEPEEQDDEMDEDNDYDHNYFDNGESYNEEDDNLDDGPVY